MAARLVVPQSKTFVSDQCHSASKLTRRLNVAENDICLMHVALSMLQFEAGLKISSKKRRFFGVFKKPKNFHQSICIFFGFLNFFVQIIFSFTF